MFKELYNLISEGQSLNIVLTRKGEKLITSVLPQSQDLKDEAKNKIQPIIATGTPDELDNEFIASISEPIQKASGILLNMESFEQQLDATQKASKAAEQLKKAEKDKKDKISKHITKAQSLEKENKKKEAIAEYEKALVIDETNVKIKQKIAQLKVALGQNSIFGNIDEEVPAEEIDFTDETSTEESSDDEDGGYNEDGNENGEEE